MSTERPHSQRSDSTLTAEERELGMDCDMTRRDFLNTLALDTGSALLSSAAPGVVKDRGATESAVSVPASPWHPWTGYGGVGDYAVSNGDTWEVVSAAHGIRDGLYEASIAGATPTGEIYDLVIVGGGFAGTIAAYTFLKETQRKRPCLILDNHPLMGGEAKRNEFIVRGQRLMGAQCSNGTAIPGIGWGYPGSNEALFQDWCIQLWCDVGLPTDFEFGQLPPGRRRMESPLCNYYCGEGDHHGYFFDSPHPHWVTNPWARNLEDTPWPPEVRRDLLRLFNEPAEVFEGDEVSLERWLDTMTYEEYLTQHRKLHPEVARYLDSSLAAGGGLGSDVLSACMAYLENQPGFAGLSKWRNEQLSAASASSSPKWPWFAFPGGNDGILRAIVKWLNPKAIEGSTAFADVHNGRIRFEALDEPGAHCRMRAGATVVRVAHDAESQGQGKPATITYVKNGQLRSVQASTVIWAGASWSGKHAIQNLPPEYRRAMERFPRSPMLTVNVALDNWRALYELGYTCCSWQGGFGFRGNIRAPMYVGDYRPVFDPDHPTIFNMYVAFPQRGLPLIEQGKVGRAKLYGTSYREFEVQIRRQLTKLFASAGFDPKRDIAGIVLNRWGHAYTSTGPGFFHGRDGQPPPSDVLRLPLGNLTFAHTELAGVAAWWNAGGEAVRAAHQVLGMLV